MLGLLEECKIFLPGVGKIELEEQDYVEDIAKMEWMQREDYENKKCRKRRLRKKMRQKNKRRKRNH